MGRLPSLIATVGVALCATVACDDIKPKVTVTNERSQAILGASSAASLTPASKPSEVAAPAAPREPRRLCAGRLGRSGPELPTEQPARRSAMGERDLPEQIGAKGHFTWINFWAAWCGPCKEEIPRLLSWEKKLNASGTAFKVVFVSLDDDERQLTTFLERQPAAGLRTTYWLSDGVKRNDWLKAVGVKPDSELPVQLLLDKSGHVRCTIGGAVDDSDFDQLRGLLNAAE
jgi:thiol-disulfide isomerase/thioredoxin